MLCLLLTWDQAPGRPPLSDPGELTAIPPVAPVNPYNLKMPTAEGLPPVQPYKIPPVKDPDEPPAIPHEVAAVSPLEDTDVP